MATTKAKAPIPATGASKKKQESSSEESSSEDEEPAKVNTLAFIN